MKRCVGAALLFCVAIVALLLPGCGGSAGGGAVPSSSRGSIVMTFENPAAVKQAGAMALSGSLQGGERKVAKLIPAGTSYLVVDLFNSAGTKVASTSVTFSPGQTSATATFDNIEAGAYAVYVAAFTAGGSKIGEGSVDVVVSPGTMAAANVTVGSVGGSKKVFVCNYGSGTVTVIDTATDVVATDITLPGGASPFAVDVAPSPDRAVVTDPARNAIYIIDTQTNSIVQTVSQANAIWEIGMKPSQVSDRRAWFTMDGPSSDSLFILNVDTFAVTPGYQLPGAQMLFASSEVTGTYGYVTYFAPSGPAGAGTYLVKVNRATQAVVAGPVVVRNAFTETWSVVDITHGKVFVTDFAGGFLRGYDTSTLTITDVVGTGVGPSCVALSPDDSVLYVTNSNDDSVYVVNPVNGSIISIIPGFMTPWRAAFHPLEKKVYVTNQGNDTVTVIETVGHTVVKQIPVGSSPKGIAVTP